MSRRCTLLLTCLFLISLNVTAVSAAGPKFMDAGGGNKHNLSSANTNVTYKAVATPGDPTRRDTQVCTFCHTPHNSAPQTVLWNRKDPTTTFGHYTSATLVIDDPGVKAASAYGEPNGSSRLCLSCHDGVTALGDVLTGPYIDFGANDKITGIAKFDANKVKSGHHPVSFRFNATVMNAINAQKSGINAVKLPTLPAVKLSYGADRIKEWMQCTSCHDPHQDQSTIPSNTHPFWVAATHDEVCLTCHDLTTFP